jgi:hypothetical protein
MLASLSILIQRISGRVLLLNMGHGGVVDGSAEVAAAVACKTTLMPRVFGNA